MKYSRGISLIEVLIASAIILTGVLALSSSFAAYVKFAYLNQKNIQAAYLAEEGLEAVTLLRDKSWSTYISPLTVETTYYLAWNATSSVWLATTTTQYIDSEFLRSFVLSAVYRDGSDKIASSGTLDTNTKKVTVSVAYFQGHSTTTTSIATYITNLEAN